MYISTDAIILKNTRYKESSIISRIFTYNHGKLSIIIKGARKSKNNISATVEPGNIINCTFYDGKSSLKTLKEVSLKKIHYHTREYLLNYYFSMAIISILDKLIEENHKLVDVYNLSVHTLEMINTKDIDLDLAFIYFLVQIMANLGFKIEAINNHNIDNKILDYLKILNNSRDINMIHDIDYQSINKIKVVVYNNIKEHLIDLNDVHAIHKIKQIKE